MHRNRKRNPNRRSDLDKIVFMCVVAGLIMTIGPLVIWWFRCDPIPDAYFEHGFNFWGKELLASVAVYWLRGKKKEAVKEDAGTVDPFADTPAG